MHIVKAWCENTKEGMGYLRYNKYRPIFRLGKFWITKKLGAPLADVKVVF